MITLQKLNVVRIVASKEEADKLKEDGFDIISEEDEVQNVTKDNKSIKAKT